jgi:tetratricopeptide (TPR) repeat protein
MERENYLKLIQDADRLINDHRMNEALSQLESLPAKRVPSAHRSALAALAVRLARPDLALGFLWKNIFEERPSEEDLFAYGSSLRKAGLVRQSLRLLKTLPQNPSVLLQEAFCHIGLWNQNEAKELLMAHQKEVSPSLKAFAVGQVNLASTLIALEDFDQALALIEAVQDLCEKNHYQLFLNCLEMTGQIHFHRGEHEKADRILKDALNRSMEQKSPTTLFVKKWFLLNQIRRGEMDKKSPQVLAFLKEARSLGHWETLRDWDFQIARGTDNKALLIHNYYGSPEGGFRKKFKALLPPTEVPAEYHWTDPRSSEKISHFIDLYRPMGTALPVGKALHRLMMALCCDFYRPWSIERIFDVLFEEEIFDPFSSPKRVYRQIEELRSFLQPLPIEFKATQQGYRLRPDPGGCLILKPRLSFKDTESYFQALLFDTFKERSFNRFDLEKLDLLSGSQWQRQLKRLTDAEKLLKEGQGRAQRYRVVSV